MGAANSRTIAILIDSALNPEGFDQAKNAISGVVLKANEFDYLMGQTYTSINKTADAGKGLGRELGGARGPVADLTRVLLSQIVATQGAGEAAKVAGVGLLFMEDAASGTHLAFAAAAAAVAFLLPLLLSLGGASKDAGDKGKEAADSFSGLLSRLQDLENQAALTSPRLKALLQVLKDEAVKDQTKELAKLAESVHENEGKAEALRRQISLWNAEMALSVASQDRLAPRVAESTVQLKELGDEHARLITKARALEGTLEDGTTTTEELKSQEDALALTKKKLQEATDRQKKAQDDLNRAFDEGRIGQLESKLRDLAPLLEKDSKALGDMEKHARLGALSDELFDLLTTVPGPAEETSTALQRLGIDLTRVQGDAEDVGAAFEEVQALFEAGVITPAMTDKINQQLLAVIDNLRSFGVDVKSPFTTAQETVIDLTQTIEDQAVPAASQLIDTMVAGATGVKIAWGDFFASMIRNFISAILKALILKSIMRAIGLAGGGMVVGGGGGGDLLGGISTGGGTAALQGGGLVTGGILGVDSVRALLMPGEVVLPVPIAEDFRELTAMAHQARQAQAGRALDLRPGISMPITILPKPDRQRDAIELIDEINTLVERRGYRLIASEVT